MESPTIGLMTQLKKKFHTIGLMTQYVNGVSYNWFNDTVL